LGQNFCTTGNIGDASAQIHLCQASIFDFCRIWDFSAIVDLTSPQEGCYSRPHLKTVILGDIQIELDHKDHETWVVGAVQLLL
jgi:hypothetical protein